jgi:hypothetical protein
MKAVVASAVEITSFIGNHRTQVLALIQIAAAATNEAEFFLSGRPGAEKKAYAQDLIIVFLTDSGFIRPDTPFSNFLTEWFIDFGIDSIVHVFSKNGLFPKHTMEQLGTP